MNEATRPDTIAPRDRQTANPVEDYLHTLRDMLADDMEGEVASYIPQLGVADPKDFGIALATVDGQTYKVGNADRRFTIQSVSKPFLYGYALREYERNFVIDHVGVEPTGEAFNSIILDDGHNRPFNPMVNTGAIAVAELMKGADRHEREANMLSLFAQFSGRAMKIDTAVFASERETGHRNRAIAYMMLNTSMITHDPEDVLDLYFRQCSVEVDCLDLATMAATLANYGVHPATGEKVLDPDHVRDILTVMNTCGMYNYAGQWAYEVGIPAKSGVSGGIMAVIPGQLGIGVYSPPLDPHGNSVRGVKVCKEISRRFGLHVFHHRTNVRSVIRNEYRGDVVASKTLRTPREREFLQEHGKRIAVVELQGALFFGSVERFIRRVADVANDVAYLVVDFRRVQLVDPAAIVLIRQTAESLRDLPVSVAFTYLGGSPALAELHAALAGTTEATGIAFLDRTDEALEVFENKLLEQSADLFDRTKFGLGQLDAFHGLNAEELRLIERVIQPRHFNRGDVLIREGDEANRFFVIARGTVSVTLSLDGERSRRIACIGPGLTVGEMALLDGGRRSANVIADESVVCYALSVDAVYELGADHPNIVIVILRNLARDFSERLRAANDEVRALE